MTDFKKGDTVSWKTPQGKTTGKVEKKETTTTTIAGHKAKATKDEPQYKVKSTKTGKEALHKPGSLKKEK